MSSPGGDSVEPGPPAAQVPAPAPDAPLVPRRGTPAIVQVRRILVVLLVAVLLYSCYFAASFILPVLVAALTALLLNPLVRLLHRLLVPRWLGALVVVVAVLAALAGLGVLVYEPALDTARNLPRTMQQIAPKLRAMTHPITEASEITQALDTIQTTEPDPPTRVQVVQPRPGLGELVENSGETLASVLAAVILCFFFLVFGDTLLLHAVMVAPTLAEKRITVEIVRSIQADVSRYMLTITLINVVLGLATAAVMWWLGMPTPLLWGALAGLLNYAPYVGPLVLIVLLGVAGLFQFDTLGEALMPALAYLGLNAVEGQFLTPMLLGSSLSLNPVIILLWLMFWGWLWGIPGFLLGVPMLVAFKIVCSRVESLQGWSTMLEK
jgi:predicted PurR-regulated permease PerM